MSVNPKSPFAEIVIRPENSAESAELQAIRSVSEAAFGDAAAADLVDKLRVGGHALVSLVAARDSAIVGHALFSRMWIATPSARISAVALAPVAVVPEDQRKGIGQRLIWQGLDLLQKRGEQIVIVLGHASYYPRFGFSTAKAALLESPFPPEAFMAMELVPGSLSGVQGRVIYPPPFGI